MQQNVTLLSKEAIREALKGNWEKVVELNSKILETAPDNQEAKLRLGHAYIQTKHLIKAKKIFNEVLEKDPLNPVARKNILLINKRIDVISPVRADPGALIKEPGTTRETHLVLVGRSMTAESFAPGENLIIKTKKRSADVYRLRKDKEIQIGEITEDEVIKCLNKALTNGGIVSASFVKGTDRHATILLKTSLPVFKADKQDVRPYIKKGSLDEAEMDEEEPEPEAA